MRRASLAGLTGVALLVGLAVLASSSAFAYFTTTGAGHTPAGVSKLPAPSITAATAAAGGTVTLTWSAAAPPGPGAVTYSVSRDGGQAAGTCPSAASPAGETACTDSGLKVGTYTYVVTARWRSWTATSAPSSAKVTIGPTHHFTLAAASSTPTAGAEDNLTITAKDENGSTVTTYTGSHSLTFSGATASPDGTKPTVANSSGKATNFGSATAITFTAGVATATSTQNGVMRLYAGGTANIAVSDGSTSTETALGVTVAPAAASKLVLTAATTTPTAGAADNLTTTAKDSYGNTATSYAGARNLTFTGPLASPGGTLPTVSNSSGIATAFGSATAINFSSGVASASGSSNGVMTLYNSGAATVKVSDGTLSTTLATTTAAASASKLLLAAASTTPVAGAADKLTTTAQDSYGNTATSYTGIHNLIFTGSSASPSGTLPTVTDNAGKDTNFGSPTAISFSSGVASSKNEAMKLSRAGAASIGAGDGSISSPIPLAVTVSPAVASNWALTSISVSAGSLGSTCLFTCTVTGLGAGGSLSAKVAVTDSLGNTVSALKAGHGAKVTTNGTGTISGTPLAIPSTGAAETATTFTYTSKSSSTEILTVAASEGTPYTTATLTASK
jgi:hypothetical protein